MRINHYWAIMDLTYQIVRKQVTTDDISLRDTGTIVVVYVATRVDGQHIMTRRQVVMYEEPGPWWEAVVVILVAVAAGILVGIWIVAEMRDGL